MNNIKSAQKYLNLIEFDAEESVVCTIKKHPIGLLSIYFTGLLVTMSVIIIGIMFGGMFVSATESEVPEWAETVIYVVSALVGITALAMTYIAAYIYQHNVIIVTSDKIVQILYKNIVDRKVSQLSLGDLQDVTVDQTGIFARLFHYGTLVIETAGEQNNFSFSYAPYPYECAKDIVGSRESSIKKYGN
jgi:uncharacterized membrane protein YdbT with pleckstrin-like domain